MNLTITCAEGLESLLADELQSFGHTIQVKHKKLVQVETDIEGAYRCCLWTRLASRVYLPLFETQTMPANQLSSWVRTLPWDQHFHADATLAVRARVEPALDWPQQLTALRIKDGYVDFWRDRTGDRPNVSTEQPDVPLLVHVGKEQTTLYLDLSVESLHRRYLRTHIGDAPIKETLAAAMLMRAGWPGKAAMTLLDPLCGSGTVLLEALMMLADHAPGLQRHHWGFLAWKGHQPAIWSQLLAEAQSRRIAKAPEGCRILGRDASADALRATRSNVVAAGYSDWVDLQVRPLSELDVLHEPGILVTNPPYGDRIGDEDRAPLLYQALAERMRQRCPQLISCVIAPRIEWLDRMGLTADASMRVHNGAEICYIRLAHLTASGRTPLPVGPVEPVSDHPLAVALQAGWREAEIVRIYDHHCHQWPLRVDRYGPWFNVIELTAMPKEQWQEAMQIIRSTLGLQRDQIRIARAGHAPRPDWLVVQLESISYQLDCARSDDAGLQLPLRRLYQHVIDRNPQRVLHLFSHNSSLALRLARPDCFVQQWEPRPHWPAWAHRQWALNGFDPDLMHLRHEDPDQWIHLLSKLDFVLITPPKSHYAEQKRQGFRWRDVHLDWFNRVIRQLNPGGQIWLAVDEKSFQPDPALLRAGLQEQNLLNEGCHSLSGHLRFFYLEK